MVQGQISGMAAGDVAAIINSGWNLFTKPTLTYNGQPLQVPEKPVPGHIANIIGLSEYSEDYVRAGATGSGFYPDTGNGDTNITPLVFATGSTAALTTTNVGTLLTSITAANGLLYNQEIYNEGFARRSAICGTSNIITWELPLREIFGFLKHNQFAMRGQVIELNLQRETNNARLIHATSGSTPNLQFAFTNIQMWVPRVQASIPVELSLNKAIEAGLQTRVAFGDWREFILANDTQTSFTWNVGMIKNARRLVFTTYDSTADSSQTVNAGIYNNWGISNFYVTVAGVNYPATQHTPNFTTKSYARSYHDFLEMFGKSNPTLGFDHGSIVNYKRFGSLYPFFCVDLSKRPKPINDIGDLQQIYIYDSFANAAAKTCVCLVETDEEMVLKGFGQDLQIVP